MRLTRKQVMDARRRYAAGESTRQIAADLGVSAPTAAAAINGRGAYADLPGAVSMRPAKQLPKLTAEQVTDARRRYAAGATLAALAEEFGCHQGTLYNAVTGNTWTELPGAVLERQRPGDRLTERDVRGIRARAAGGEPASSIARDYGVAAGTIYDVVGRKTWRDVPDVLGARLTERDVRGIRARYACGEPASSIARDYPVTDGAIYSVVSRRTWADVPDVP